MKRLVLCLLLCAGLTFAHGEGLKVDQKMNEGVISGTISLPEISGAVSLGNRLLVAADDPEDSRGVDKQFHMIALIKDAVARLKSKIVTVDSAEQIYEKLLQKIPGQAIEPGTIKDLEDVTASPKGDIFLISSHSISKKNEEAPKRRQSLVRLRVNNASGEIKNVALRNDTGLLRKLPEELKDSTKRRPGAKNDGKYDPGFNIEGLAWAPEGDLLIGLRSPTLESKAIVLRLRDANDIFDKPAGPVLLEIEAKLDLGGMGIRGMCYDEARKGYWIIAGLSADLDKPDSTLRNEWSIWFWNGKKTSETGPELEKKWQKADLPAGITLENPEAVSLVADHLLLISDDGKSHPSSYVLVPLARLK